MLGRWMEGDEMTSVLSAPPQAKMSVWPDRADEAALTPLSPAPDPE